MGDPQVGWIAAIVVGGIAGWLAEQFMKSDMGVLMNIVLGIIGAAIGGAIFGFFGIAVGGWIGYLIAGFVGACLLIWVVRALRGRAA
ncbi:putative membrane protein YeaQ/YmgE (transglycosylase-associated protein family) [Rhodoblastus acidophilus]|uniref:GlsB/YeaQ/YmgE family stress response membrane protein n=1 Tax=Rhodoblastus acidophilus TaxID=1074 RepID=UPI002224BD36|nr:GlsB/YeaQ/YmgE family stress response membrane protein [Rhodoblastus acidophilus]MCW2286145.1 putative membrane protein YeaQ/YmgE (transglycosylase-associated protein family) [Rhodoblastus acidophilus]MCW2335039.1 putative membrane protein YeaQ/YmgE (transglycosylase-associated protein family) [Rhodoblastus acidophilus]